MPDATLRFHPNAPDLAPLSASVTPHRERPENSFTIALGRLPRRLPDTASGRY